MSETYGPRTKGWLALTDYAQKLRAHSITDLFGSDVRRFARFSCEVEGLLLDFSRQLLDTAAVEALLALAEQTEVTRGIELMFGWVGRALRFQRRRPCCWRCSAFGTAIS